MSDELIADRSNYGDPVENHRRIAKMWSAWLGHEIQPHQVACMMVLENYLAWLGTGHIKTTMMTRYHT